LTPGQQAHSAGKALPCLVLLALLATGCSPVQLVKKMFSGELVVEVLVDPKLNQGSALAVDLVVIKDKKLAPVVLEMSARDWFRQREQFARDHPSGFMTWSWEVVPGEAVEPRAVEVGRGVETAVVFADYLAPGPHREQVDPRRHLVLYLGERGFGVRPRE
jgi:hypothetical protein